MWIYRCCFLGDPRNNGKFRVSEITNEETEHSEHKLKTMMNTLFDKLMITPPCGLD